jgi:hypothetical protein
MVSAMSFLICGGIVCFAVDAAAFLDEGEVEYCIDESAKGWVQCPDTRAYEDVDEQDVEDILDVLEEQGFVVEGDNPWTLYIKKFFTEIEITGLWEYNRLLVSAEKNGPVSCKRLFEALDDAVDPLLDILSMESTDTYCYYADQKYSEGALICKATQRLLCTCSSISGSCYWIEWGDC